MEDNKKKYKTAKEPVSMEGMERLAQIMTDAPTIAKLANTEFAITSLKPAVMWEISKEALSIQRVEDASFSDVLKGLSLEIPSVCRIITLAILNDKRIYDEQEYNKIYDTLFWECDVKEWAQLLFEILNLLSVDAFFLITDLTQTFKTMALERKMKMKEQKLS